MLGTILVILLILALIGAFPRWGYSSGWVMARLESSVSF